MQRRTLLFFLIVVVLALGAAYIDFWPNANSQGQSFHGLNNPFTLKQGLDLQGGVSVLLLPDPSKHYDPATINSSIGDVRNQIEQRVNGLVGSGIGIGDQSVRIKTVNGIQGIYVEIPGLNSGDQNAIIGTLRKTGNLEFWNTGPDHIPIGTKFDVSAYATYNPQGKAPFIGNDLDPQQIYEAPDPQAGYPVIHFAMRNAKLQDFASYTQQNTGSMLTVTLDKVVIESAQITGSINGPGIIDSKGQIGLAQAQQITTVLRYGSLPIALNIASQESIGPSLGQDSLVRCEVAGVVGMCAVMLFMLIYYRLPGLLADIALLLYALFNLAIFKVIGVSLTLPGIAGFILSIGMAVDANVLIFERIKEELRAGRVLVDAIQIGWKRAWPSIRDSNVASLIICSVLYYFGSNGASVIQGFATTLALGVAISMFTAIVVTRTFLTLLVATGKGHHPHLFGMALDVGGK